MSSNLTASANALIEPCKSDDLRVLFFGRAISWFLFRFSFARLVLATRCGEALWLDLTRRLGSLRFGTR